MLDRLFVLVQYVLPQILISRIAGKLADSKPPAVLKNAVIRWFIGRYGVNMSEAAEEDPTRYPSFNEFFTRALKPGIRPMGGHERSIISPVDGTVSQLGQIERDRVFQAKGQSFNLTELLGGDEDRARGSLPPSTWLPKTITASICRWRGNSGRWSTFPVACSRSTR